MSYTSSFLDKSQGLREYLGDCIDAWFHPNASQTLFYKCLTAFTAAFITALWSPVLVFVLFFLILGEVLICTTSLYCGRRFCITSRIWMLFFAIIGWFLGRWLANMVIGYDDPC